MKIAFFETESWEKDYLQSQLKGLDITIKNIKSFSKNKTINVIKNNDTI